MIVVIDIYVLLGMLENNGLIVPQIKYFIRYCFIGEVSPTRLIMACL
jgi:hypothetical protein